jgi:hypothetical protein
MEKAVFGARPELSPTSPPNLDVGRNSDKSNAEHIPECWQKLKGLSW